MDEGTNEQEQAAESSSSTPTPPSSEGAAFSSSEGLVSFGAIVIIAGWLLFEVILNDYGTSFVPLLLCLVALALPRANRGFVESIAPLPSLMKAVGYMIGLIAIVAIVENIRFAGTALDSFTEVLGAMAYIGGSAIAFLGARSIET